MCVYSSHLSENHSHELLVVDIPISVYVCLRYELVCLLLAEHLADVGHHGRQLRSGDEPVTLLVKHTESLSDLLLNIPVIKLSKSEFN